jgi:MarR family transcriptional regulator, temperature-dependent positive regulator of motility
MHNICYAKSPMTARKHTFRDYVNFRLDMVSRAAREAADQVYKRQCGLDILHIRILRIVAETPDLAVNSVVRESMLDRTLVSRMISHLVRQSLIRRTISLVDARQVLLATTPAGEQRVRKANALGDALNLELLSVLDKNEIEVLDRCLVKLAAWRPKEESRPPVTRTKRHANI